MINSLEVLEALEAVEATRDQLKHLAKGKPENWVKEYATHRASLREQLERLIAASKAWLLDQGDSDGSEKFAELIAAAKTRMEKHQARWPVVMIDIHKEDYIASMTEVEATYAEVGRFLRARAKG